MRQAPQPTADAGHRRRLEERILSRTSSVGVIGAGYIGLPLAVEQAKAGFTVVAFDQNLIRVAQINQGSSYMRDVDERDIAEVVASGRLSATSDFSSLEDFDVLVMCVPTPVTRNKDPDTSFLRRIGAEIAQSLRPGTLITLESTTYPGVTQ